MEFICTTCIHNITNHMTTNQVFHSYLSDPSSSSSFAVSIMGRICERTHSFPLPHENHQTTWARATCKGTLHASLYTTQHYTFVKQENNLVNDFQEIRVVITEFLHLDQQGQLGSSLLTKAFWGVPRPSGEFPSVYNSKILHNMFYNTRLLRPSNI